jgi:hypothetical protein
MTKNERIDILVGAVYNFLEENEKPFVIDECDLYKIETFLDDYCCSKDSKKNICRCLNLDKFSISEYKTAVDIVLENLGFEIMPNPGFGCEQDNLIVIGV